MNNESVLDIKYLKNHCDLNEATVRMRVIDPIIKQLGYLDGEDTYTKLEQKLEYPYYHIGHKSRKDLPLGFADYQCGVQGRKGSFIIEAKAQSKPIGSADIEQAHSYASHALVGANYFVICDGIRWQVFETLSGASKKPILDIPVLEINGRLHEISNILAPKRLTKLCERNYDSGLPLNKNFGSTAEIIAGKYEITEIAHKLLVNGLDLTAIAGTIPQFAQLETLKNQLSQFNYTTRNGKFTRDGNGRIVVDLKFNPITKSNGEAMRMLGIDEMCFWTNDISLSCEQMQPTIFETNRKLSVPEGTQMPGLFGEVQNMDHDMIVDVFVTMRAFDDAGVVIGDFDAFADYQIQLPNVGNIAIQLDFTGTLYCEIIER